MMYTMAVVDTNVRMQCASSLLRQKKLFKNVISPLNDDDDDDDDV